eukprot:CAMPEP_0206153906 /NCGR_PEP_ID=MMETSP1474-20131121/979_1 /ASSEMBLY_ACC=CAM_ASM_001110 /TAXON_ID=97495 /ORGANISM="Imantonia sp., Strain RCC918" /LENGTH=38 /DNA_ID= /DNA_START= /DNA_END= /DNA_ORIENTATION=
MNVRRARTTSTEMGGMDLRPDNTPAYVAQSSPVSEGGT